MTVTVKPLIHLGGTPREHLVEQYREAQESLRAAREALRAAAPHARDYDHAPEAYAVAQAEHLARVTALEAVLADLIDLHEHVA